MNDLPQSNGLRQSAADSFAVFSSYEEVVEKFHLSRTE